MSDHKHRISGTFVLVVILIAAMAAATGVTWFMTHRPH
jgi:hypothetical protein